MMAFVQPGDEVANLFAGTTSVRSIMCVSQGGPCEKCGLERRALMMKAWAEFCSRTKQAKVVPLRRARRV
jgi:hypothetical protein